jgi:hypothetical protein
MADPTVSANLYNQDFYAWANQQAGLLRAGRLDAADIANIAEEIASIGRSERRELINRLAVLTLHLLKWQVQPAFRGRSWRLSIEEQRLRLASHLADNPSLKAKVPEAIREAYRLAQIDAERETGLSRSTFPPACPWTFEQMMDDGFLPECGEPE